MKPPPKPSPPAVPDRFLRTLLVRLAMLLVLAGSVWLVWSSVNRLTLVNRQLKQKTSAVSVLADEVQKLERKSDPAEVAQTEARFEEAKKALFAGPVECAQWQKELEEKTLALGLEASIQPSQPRPHPRTEHKLSLLSTTVDLQPPLSSAITNFPYQRLVNFTRILQKPKQRIDLLDLVVLGNSNSIRHATAVLQLWSQEGKP